jgi:hypothetical protein
VSGATYYYLLVQTPDGNVLFGKWYAATSCTGTTWSVTPEGLNLPNGIYQWRIRDYGDYGYGAWTALQDFTLNLPLPGVTLGEPIGTMTSWDQSFNWTGVSGATYYYLLVQTPDGNVLFGKWYAATSCTGTTCSVTPEGLNLPNGIYQWQIRDYGDYGYRAWTALQDFTLTNQ